MGRDDAISRLKQRVIGRRRFNGEDIQPRASDSARVESLGQIIFDDQRASAGIQ